MFHLGDCYIAGMKTGTAIGIITPFHRVYLIRKGIYLGFNSEDRIKEFVTEPWER